VRYEGGGGGKEKRVRRVYVICRPAGQDSTRAFQPGQPRPCGLFQQTYKEVHMYSTFRHWYRKRDDVPVRTNTYNSKRR
jgi:hypothetical protein